jgi:DNA adenine methylase
MKPSGCDPLLKWAGGKRRLLKEILPFVPTAFGHYYEPFFGGGALFFSLRPTAATLSDTNFELIETYLQVRDNLDVVLQCLRGMPNSEQHYYLVRRIKPKSPAHRAARLIYLCSLSFNGIYRQNLKGEFNVPYGYKFYMNPSDDKKLRRVTEAIKGTKIMAADFESAVSTAKPGDFIYFDPPYTVAHGNNGFIKYNAKIFSWADQERLAETACRLKRKGCRLIISNAHHPSIYKLYRSFQSHVIERHSIMAASSEYRRAVREVLFY